MFDNDELLSFVIVLNSCYQDFLNEIILTMRINTSIFIQFNDIVW